jgi:hypothetical protein
MCCGVATAPAAIPADKRGAVVSQSTEGPDMMPPDVDRLDQKRREKQSKRNRGLPGWSNGPASEGRRLTGAELDARAQALGATVTEPRKVSHRAEIAAVGQQPMPKTSRHRQLPAWLKARMRAQRRLFDIDRPERAAAYAPGTGLTIEAAEGDKP